MKPFVIALAAAAAAVAQTAAGPYVKLKALDLNEVRWTGGFWAERFETVRRNALPVILEAIGNPANGAQYASFVKGPNLDVKRLNWWSDGDVYKTVEAMALVWASTKDPALDRRMDEMISAFAAAQEPDGYISTPIRLKRAERWQLLNHHELYNMGHLMTAACTHYRMTGKKNFLDVAIKVGDYLHATFQPRPARLAHFGFNPSNIMGAVDLYRATGNGRYLELAQTFVDMRGSARGGSDQNQTRTPLRKEIEAVGHAVTANYLYAGATDVYGETGEKELLDALGRIWTDVTTRKMYVTGAVGNLFRGRSRLNDDVHEAFGLDYELPNRLAYTETCANIANAMWNWRLLGLSGDAKYADVVELVLYNSMLSGMGIEGKDFYYANPLRRHADEVPRVVRTQDPPLRSPVLPCYCCPTNLARTIAGLRGWAYAKSADALWVNLFGASRVETAIAGGRMAVSQATDFPWDGVVRFTIEQAPPREASLMVRIPGWAEGATLDGRKPAAGSYAALRRVWRAGDRVELLLPMEPRLVAANPYVESARNQVAVMRGPVVYALESPDLPAGVRLSEITLSSRARMTARFEKSLLGGVAVVEAEARVRPEGEWAGLLYRTLRPGPSRSMTVRLIPYFAWSNRGMSHMSVWLPLAD
ncbi:MAG: glycoside hydrolase family 127 protein [Bryobacteraceae bacterium]